MLRPIIRRFAGNLVVLAGLLVLAACAATNPAAPTADTGSTPILGYGVIASIRPITVSTEAHTNLVGAFGGPMPRESAPVAPAAAAIEFIVRDDTGNTISVVQTNEANFRPGERVGLTRGPRTRIVRLNP